ncbi:MAG: PP2C family protein-serine/threonine phosphatase [Candidatus Competibacteraceae bacterium]
MFEIAYTMHRGKQNHHQEDCILVNGDLYQECVLPVAALSLAADEVLLAVADGVHSSPMPHRASRTVLEELTQAIREHPEWLQGGFVANRHLRQVQERLADRLAVHPQTFGTASTIAVAHIRGQRAAILNVGDSRVYHSNGEGQWQRLSKDHTVLQGMIDKGQALPDTVYSSMYMMLEHVLCADHEENDFAIHRIMVPLMSDDRLVLCSDGIHDEIGEEMMWTLFDPSLDVKAQTKLWRDAVWRHGAKDNLSLVVAVIE